MEHVGTQRVKRLFQFLREFHHIRNPIKRHVDEQLWVMWLKDLPDHPSVDVSGIRIRAESNSQPASEGNLREHQADTKAEDQPILRVRRPKITHPPRPPQSLREWLLRGWDDPFREVQIRQVINEPVTDDAPDEAEAVRFADDPERVQAYESWKQERDEWAVRERPARAAMKVFEQLYELYGRIERESERLELVLGDGILSWGLPSGGVYHPLLLQRVQLQFDPKVPEFTVTEADLAVELYSAVLRLMPEATPGALTSIRRQLEERGFHPLGGKDTADFLRRLVQVLSSQGRFEPEAAPPGDAKDPVIGRSPVLFLRDRALGFEKAIEGILENLSDGAKAPKSLDKVVGVSADEPGDLSEGDAETREASPEDAHDILFTKPWNQEQIQIANRLERHGAVIVQGPPGTGKTHTIANLIGHLLANDKSVLVTAHTTKALRVLRDQIVEPLRPLCVSLLESDLEGRRLLEDSVHHIVERLSLSNAEALDREAQLLRKQRRRIQEKLRTLREKLLEARSAEYREVAILGETFSPSAAARKAAREREEHGWIPGPVEPGVPLPLSPSELIRLYETNAMVSAEDEKELSLALPDPGDLPKPEEYESLLSSMAELSREDRDYRSDMWEEGQATDPSELEEARLAVRDASLPFVEAGPVELAVMWAGFKGAGYREVWDGLLEAINVAEERAQDAAESLARFAPRLADDISLEEQSSLIDRILETIAGSGKLSGFHRLVHPTWHRLVRAARVGDRSPGTKDEFLALKRAVDLELARKELLRWWNYLVGGADGPRSGELGDRPEQAAGQFAPMIRRCLDWAENQFEPAVQRLKDCGFRWDAFLEELPPDLRPQGELLRLGKALTEVLPPIIDARIAAVRWAQAQAEVQALRSQLEAAVAQAQPSEVVRQLLHAVKASDPVEYRAAYGRLLRLDGSRQAIRSRRELLAKLETAAPAWASAVRSREGIHGGTSLPGEPQAAWLWRQLEQELDRRASLSVQEIQDELTDLTERLYDVTSQLVENLAWAAQIRRTTAAQQQSLVGWLNTMKRIGAGYGKRAPHLRAEAARLMADARTAVPVWIMPISRAVGHFDPKTTRFDVVIIDEASQSDVRALAALYLGKRVVVVGDDEQVSPDAVGEQTERIEPLISEYLQGIPNAHLYDGRRSIYDIAWESFGGGLALLEHFRCVPEIIQFSNALSYNGRIKPLRESSGVNLKPHVVSYEVRGFSSGRVNREEALTVAFLLAAASKLPEYAGKTFGVISLVGEEQALLIDRILRDPEVLPTDEHRRRRILCGTSAQFQGDERDVVFLSMVDGPGEGPLAMRQDDRFRRRFNVAASRARDQLWLIYSLDPSIDLKPRDLRRRLIEYVRDPEATMRALEREERRAQSEFEREVLARLVARNYRVRAQWPVGYYRIDLVVEGGGKRLAIECDGDRYHPPEKLEEDMARQAVLERLGWRFVRVRGSEFFRDPGRAMESIFERLEQMGIPPEGERPEDIAGETAALDEAEMKGSAASRRWSPLVDKVSRLAAELRREWSEGEQELDPIGSEVADETDRRRSDRGEKLPVQRQWAWEHGREGGRGRDETREAPGRRGPEVVAEGARGQPLAESAVRGRSAPSRPPAPLTEPSSRRGEQAKAKDSDEQLVAWVSSTTPELWFSMSRWAKDNGLFDGWERKLLYSIGRYLHRGWTVSFRQARQAKRLYDEAVSRGFGT